jgi:hypothetical protein
VTDDLTTRAEPDEQLSDRTPGAERTGHPVVDRVLDSLDGLRDLPVAERVAVFEAAHDELRSALAGARDAAAQPHA